MLYLGLACINLIIIIASNYIHWELLQVAQNSNGYTEFTDQTTILSKGQQLYDQYYDLHFIVLLLYSFSSFCLMSLLLKSRWLPAWLCIWGIIAAILVTIAATASLSGHPLPFYFFVQNGLFMLFLTGWLLVWGFKTDPKS